MIRFQRVILFIFIVSIPLLGQRPQYVQRHMTVGDGLSQNLVRTLAKDDYGFLWCGTADGLDRYDGYMFREFHYRPNDSTALADNAIQVIRKDREGYLWIGTEQGGLDRYDPENERFDHFGLPGELSLLTEKPEITSLAPGGDSVWVGMSTGLWILYPQGKTWESRPLTNNESGIIKSLLLDRDNTLWIGTDHGLYRRFLSSGETEAVFNASGEIFNNNVFSLYRDSMNQLWAACRGGLYSVDENQLIMKRLDLGPEEDDWEVFSLIEDNHGKLWIGTDRLGLFGLDLKSRRRFAVRLDEQKKEEMNPAGIYSLLIDNDDLLWVGTRGNGLFVFNTQPLFTYYPAIPDDNYSLAGNSVRGIYLNRDSVLWVGGYTGLKAFDRKRGTARHYRYDADEKGGLPSPDIYCFVEDETGQLWIGTEGKGLTRLNPRTGEFKRFPSRKDDPGSWKGDFVFVAFLTSKGDLWFGTDRGAVLLKKENRIRERFEHFDLKDPDLLGHDVTAITEDKDGNIWIGTENSGLKLFNPFTNNFITLSHSNSRPQSLSDNRILCLLPTEGGDLWIGTKGGGLNRLLGNDFNPLNPATTRFKHYGEEEGLLNSVVYGIMEDSNGLLWLSTNAGIWRFDPARETFRDFPLMAGQQSREFNRGSWHKGWNGEMFFGGINGLNSFFPEKFTIPYKPPPLAFTDISVFNADMQLSKTGQNAWRSLSAPNHMQELTVNHKNISTTFEISALSFIDPPGNRYRYRITGLIDDWLTLPPNKRDIILTHLPSGTYQVEIQAANAYGIWNKSGKSLTLRVSPPPWLSWWALTGYVMAILGMFWFIRWYELKRLRLRNQLKDQEFITKSLEEVNRLKSEFFANISHEFRTPLTLIKGRLSDIQLALSSHQQKNLDRHFKVTMRNLDNLEDLMNQMLELSRIEAGTITLDLRTGDLVQFIKHIETTLRPLAEKAGLSFFVRLPDHPVFARFDEIRLERVVHNLIVNAVDFTPEGGEVNLNLDIPTSEKAVITVADTGTGIPAEKIDRIFERFYQVDSSLTRSHGGTGIGLALVKELTELHGGTVSVSSREREGTVFRLELPAIPGKEQTAATFQVNDEKRRGRTGLLIVEDNRDMAEYIADCFDDKFITEWAGDGINGLEKARGFLPDIIISDVMMPRMDGFTMVREIRSDKILSHVPIIMLTAKSDRKDRMEGLVSLADAYVTKPFNPEELLSQVNNLLQNRRLLIKKFSDTWMINRDISPYDGPDQDFLVQLQDDIHSHLADSAYTVDNMARAVFLSRRQLERRLRDLAGITPNELLRKTRLAQARTLLEENTSLTVGEVAQRVGFQDTRYFSRLFRREFGATPSAVKSQS